MTIDSVMINTLMRWARLQAPLSTRVVNGERQRRPVRLELSVEHPIAPPYNLATTDRVMCRVYPMLCEENFDLRLDHLIKPCWAETRIA